MGAILMFSEVPNPGIAHQQGKSNVWDCPQVIPMFGIALQQVIPMFGIAHQQVIPMFGIAPKIELSWFIHSTAYGT